MSSTETALTVHLVMPGGHPGESFLVDLCEKLKERFGIGHATFQVETDPQTACPLEPESRRLKFKVPEAPIRQIGLMDSLTLFGLFAVTAIMVCYAIESRSHWFVLASAGTCVLASAYGFLARRVAVWRS